MRYSLRVSNSIVSVSLTDGDPVAGTLRYVPKEGKNGFGVVSEPCDFLVIGRNNARQTVNRLNRLFERAREYERTKSANKVFVYLQTEDDDAEWRSQVFNGSATWDDQALDTQWATGCFEVRVTWGRAAGWDRVEKYARLSNHNGTDVTSGLQIFNHDDYTGSGIESGAWLGPLGLTASADEIEDADGHDNWVQIHPDDLEGDLPSPCRIEIKNTYGAGANRIYIAHFVDGTGECLVLEGEDAIGAGSVLPGSPNTTLYSKGKYKQGSAGTGGVPLWMMEWGIPSALLLAAQGRAFRVMLRLANPYTAGTTRLFTRIQINTTSVLWESQKVAVDASETLIDLGAVILPTLRHSENPPAISGVEIALYSQSFDGGTLDVDFIQFMPATNFRKLEPITSGLLVGETLVDDGISQALYKVNDGAELASYVGDGEQIKLVPGSLQTLYFLQSNLSGGAEVLRTSDIRIAVRGRRSTL